MSVRTAWRRRITGRRHQLQSLIGEMVIPRGEKRDSVDTLLRRKFMALLDLAADRNEPRHSGVRIMTTAVECPRDHTLFSGDFSLLAPRNSLFLAKKFPVRFAEPCAAPG